MLSKTKEGQIVLAIDAMGGDHAPHATVEAASLVLEDKGCKDVYFKIFGKKDRIIPLLKKYPNLINCSELIHSEQVVSPEEVPSSAIRNCKKSSMQMAINAVKAEEAHAVVSAGNTGALMAMSTITLRTLPQIHRPAIITFLPTTKGRVAVLDLGANVESDANNLYQFAIMGEVFVKILENKKDPSIGLLNIGSEETKGKDSIKLAHSLLQNSSVPINYKGYVEGNDVALGETDVVVTDGFTGNVLLKSISGYAKVYVHFMKKAFNSSLLSKLHYLISKPTLGKISKSLDNRSYNGAMLVGLNGIVVKSHGSMDALGIANAIKTAYDLAKNNVNEQISNEISQSDHLED